MLRKEINKYYFSVEGETERWYLKWLQDQINNYSNAKKKVQFDPKVEKNPLKYAKRLNTLSRVEVVHVMDFEELNNESAFKTTLDFMRQAESKTKKVKYQLGYSNYCFELWMILHKRKFTAFLPNKDSYLPIINSVYQQSFESLLQYKHEENFKKILSMLSLDDVLTAISNADDLENKHYQEGHVLISHKNFSYYRNNPSLNIHEFIKKIFIEVGIIE